MNLHRILLTPDISCKWDAYPLAFQPNSNEKKKCRPALAILAVVGNSTGSTNTSFVRLGSNIQKNPLNRLAMNLSEWNKNVGNKHTLVHHRRRCAILFYSTRFVWCHDTGVHFSMTTTLNSFSKVQHVVRSTVPVLLQPESSNPSKRMYENERS